MLKLGTIVQDNVTELEGMLTHYVIDMSGNENYIFQPKVLNPKTGQPIKTAWIDVNRITGGVEEPIELPLNILGTEATDRASGYKGKAIQLVYHMNGCIHFTLKSKEKLEDGETIDAIDVDMRRLEGEAIPVLNEPELKEDRKRNLLLLLTVEDYN